MPQNDNSLAGPRSWKTSIFSTFWKVFKTDENHHQLTPGQTWKVNIENHHQWTLEK